MTPEWFPTLYQKLLFVDVASQLPGEALSPLDELAEEELSKLIAYASLLSLSERIDDRRKVYEICTRVTAHATANSLLEAACALLARLGNFPAAKLARDERSVGGLQHPSQIPRYVELEVLSRRVENMVEGPGERKWLLTDFQLSLFETLKNHRSVSVSAPTSAGKSFILGLDIVRRIAATDPCSVVYVAPSRALVRQISRRISELLRETGLKHVLVRTTPIAFPPDVPKRSVVYVLTQERLLSLVHGRVSPWIDVLIVDEAQQIGDGARGIVLQSAIEQTLRIGPRIPVVFAAPMIEKPQSLLAYFDMEGKGFSESESPVSRNTILVSDVPGDPRALVFDLYLPDRTIALGQRLVKFRMRDRVFDQRAAFADAITKERESTLIYADGPDDAESLAASMAGLESEQTVDSEVLDLIKFIEVHIHPQYKLIEVLKRRVAFHYGRMPVLLRNRVEDLFASGKLKYICCTSTLLHGVNLPARHLVVERPQSAQGKPMERHDFVNLAGRAGRLGFEFHGNVWCLRPEKWKKPAYMGPETTEVVPAMSKLLADGGSMVNQLIQGRIDSNSKVDAETAYGKLFLDCAIRGQEIEQSKYWQAEFANELKSLVSHCRSIVRTLPNEYFERHFQILPERLEKLAAAIREADDIESLSPLPPFEKGFSRRLYQIFRLVGGILGGLSARSSNYHAGIAFGWIREFPLFSIIQKRIEWVTSTDPESDIHKEIRAILNTIESGLAFNFVKYLGAYVDVLDVVRKERNMSQIDSTAHALPYYLEAGAYHAKSLGLIGLGISRSTSILIARRHLIGSDWDMDSLRQWLDRVDLATLRLPRICIQELRDWRGHS